jgi:hypothetical protein
MQIAVQPSSVDESFGSTTYKPLCHTLDREPRKAHDFATLELLREAPPTPAEDQSETDMTDQRTPVREDVVRMLKRFVEVEYFGVRSGSGRLVIDESRMPRKRRGQTAEEIREFVATASAPEVMDAIVTANIRRAVYASPAARNEAPTPGPFVMPGDRLHCVAPRNDVSNVVSIKAGRGGNAAAATDRDAQLWKSTVAAKLARIPKVEQRAVISAEILRLELVEIRNALQAARTAVERLRGGKKRARVEHRPAEDRRSALAAIEEKKSDQLKALVRTTVYRDGLDRLWYLCAADEAVRVYMFREEQ